MSYVIYAIAKKRRTAEKTATASPETWSEKYLMLMERRYRANRTYNYRKSYISISLSLSLLLFGCLSPISVFFPFLSFRSVRRYLFRFRFYSDSIFFHLFIFFLMFRWIFVSFLFRFVCLLESFTSSVVGLFSQRFLVVAVPLQRVQTGFVFGSVIQFHFF